jgi:hypothetical protein
MKILSDWTFKWWEIGLIKLCLISFGIILALYFENYLAGLLWLWWVIFILTAV